MAWTFAGSTLIPLWTFGHLDSMDLLDLWILWGALGFLTSRTFFAILTSWQFRSLDNLDIMGPLGDLDLLDESLDSCHLGLLGNLDIFTT